MSNTNNKHEHRSESQATRFKLHSKRIHIESLPDPHVDTTEPILLENYPHATLCMNCPTLTLTLASQTHHTEQKKHKRYLTIAHPARNNTP